MRVLVTGDSGLVGSAIVSLLVSRGDDVFGLSRRAQGGGGAKRLVGDISTSSFVSEFVGKLGACDAVVHAAASLSMMANDPSIALVNCLGTQHVLELARRCGARNAVYISSLGVIGCPGSLPITELHSISPLTAYHASKLFGEHLAGLWGSTDRTASALRVSAPVGPGMPPGRILTQFVERALRGEPLVLHGRGTRRQNYVDVRDVAEAVARCLDGRPQGVFNIGGRASVSNLELAERCVEAVGSASPITYSGKPDPDDDLDWRVSLEKAEKAFGYDPQYTIEDSIQSVMEEARSRMGL